MQHRFDVFFNFVGLIHPVAFDNNMAVQCRSVLLHLPQVDMMHVHNAIDTLDRSDHVISINIWWAPKHQGSNWAPYFGEGQIQDVERDADGDGRIHPTHIIKYNERPADYDGH